MAGNPTAAATSTAQQQAFINQVLPYALAESKKTGIPAEVYITQSGVETGWGTSGWWLQNHNPAGIGVTGAPGAGNSYSDVQAAFADYSARLLGYGESGQGQFVKDVQGGATATTLLSDLEASPWAKGGYGGTGLTDAYAQVFGTDPATANPSAYASYTPPANSGAQNVTLDSKSKSPADLIKEALLSPAAATFDILGIKTPLSQVGAISQFLFGDWRYVVEVVLGIGMVLLGVFLTVRETGAYARAKHDAEGAAAIGAAA